MYNDWKGKVDNARADALHCGNTATVKYNLQLVKAVEEAIWVEEIRLQDEAVAMEQESVAQQSAAAFTILRKRVVATTIYDRSDAKIVDHSTPTVHPGKLQ